MSEHFADAWEAYHFLNGHGVRGHYDTSFIDVLDVFVAKVNPETCEIDDDPTKNTKVEVWLESGAGYCEPHPIVGSVPLHDWDIDCGGDTFEEAIMKLAENVREKYGASNRYDDIDRGVGTPALDDVCIDRGPASSLMPLCTLRVEGERASIVEPAPLPSYPTEAETPTHVANTDQDGFEQIAATKLSRFLRFLNQPVTGKEAAVLALAIIFTAAMIWLQLRHIT